MKFAHLLLTLSESNPEFRILHTIYKQAKKALKRIGAVNAGASLQTKPLSQHCVPQQQLTASPQPSLEGVSAAVVPSWQAVRSESEFAHELVQSIHKLDVARDELQRQSNARLAELQGVAQHPENIDLHDLFREAVQFHGEVLLVMNWSLLAYTTCLKILKKHHKRTGLLLQAPEVRDMLSHPSWSTEGMANVATAAEALVTHVQQLVLEQQLALDAAPQLVLEPEAHVDPGPPAAAAANQPTSAPPTQLQPCAVESMHFRLGLEDGGRATAQGGGDDGTGAQGGRQQSGSTAPALVQTGSRRRPAAASGSSGSGVVSGASGGAAASADRAVSADGGGMPAPGTTGRAHRFRKKSHFGSGSLDDASSPPQGGSIGLTQPPPSQEEAALSKYARHAAQQQQSLRALQARHVIARWQHGATAAANATTPSLGPTAPATVTPAVQVQASDAQEALLDVRHSPGPISLGAFDVRLSLQPSPPQTTRPAHDLPGTVLDPQDSPAFIPSFQVQPTPVPMLPVLDVPSWEPLILLSRMHTSSIDSDWEDDYGDQDQEMARRSLLSGSMAVSVAANRMSTCDHETLDAVAEAAEAADAAAIAEADGAIQHHQQEDNVVVAMEQNQLAGEPLPWSTPLAVGAVVAIGEAARAPVYNEGQWRRPNSHLRVVGNESAGGGGPGGASAPMLVMQQHKQQQLGLGATAVSAPISQPVAIPTTVSRRSNTVARSTPEPSASASGSCSPPAVKPDMPVRVHANAAAAAAATPVSVPEPMPPMVGLPPNRPCPAVPVGPVVVVTAASRATRGVVREEEEEVTSAVPRPAWHRPFADRGSGDVGLKGGGQQTAAVKPPSAPAGSSLIADTPQHVKTSDHALVHQMRLAMQAWQHLTAGSVTPSTNVPLPPQQAPTSELAEFQPCNPASNNSNNTAPTAAHAAPVAVASAAGSAATAAASTPSVAVTTGTGGAVTAGAEERVA